MSDNTTINAGSGGDVIATDDIAGVKHQRVKISVGPDGTAVDASAAAPLPTTDAPATATLANVSASASSVTLQASNSARRGFVLYNDSSAILYVKFGSTASTTSFTYYVPPFGTLELPRTVYSGIITGIWASATGSARVTELTA